MIDGQIHRQARRYGMTRGGCLQMLAGKWHEVLTGVAIVSSGETYSADQRTRVKFATMTDAEIAFLAEMGEPLDKAGAYAVQAQAALFIEGIEGDYWNVVGLPINLVYEMVMNRRSAKRHAGPMSNGTPRSMKRGLRSRYESITEAYR